MQVLRSGTSVGANYVEADRARSTAEFIAKMGDSLKELDFFPPPDVGPEFYVDYDETGPYVADVGDGECAAT